MIMFIGVNALHRIVLFEVIFNQQIQYFDIDGYLREAYENTAGDFLMSDLVEPRVLSDVRDLKTLFRVCVQNISDQISRVLGHKFRDSVISI